MKWPEIQVLQPSEIKNRMSMADETTVTRAAPTGVFWEKAYPGKLDALREVRCGVRESLAGYTDALADDVETVVSELAANAVRHSRSGLADGTYTVRIVSSLDGAVPCICVEVEDMGSLGWDGTLDLNPMHGFAVCYALTHQLGSAEAENGNRVVYARIHHRPDGKPCDRDIDPRVMVDPGRL
jgi:hypothetical protein